MIVNLKCLPSIASIDPRRRHYKRAARSRAPLRERIVLFDAVLTTGKHYKCCERRLRQVLADIPISGLFVARRVLPCRRCRAPSSIQAGSARALTAP